MIRPTFTLALLAALVVADQQRRWRSISKSFANPNDFSPHVIATHTHQRHTTLPPALRFLLSKRGGEAAEVSSGSMTLVKPSNDLVVAVPKQNDDHDKDKKSTKSGRRQESALARATPDSLINISHHVDDVRAAARRWKRREFVALLLARMVFILVLPLSAIAFVVTVALSILMTVFRIITFNFCFRETSRILYSSCKAMLGAIFASLTGIFLPVFALFGLVASVATAACEIAEPILRIRYQRQLKKLRHLQKILTDPVLMETMEYLLRGAEAVSLATAAQVDKAGRHVGKAGAGVSRFALGAGKKAAQQIQDNSVQLVETMLASPEIQNIRQSIEQKMPSRLNEWTRDQWESLRKSGILEDAARAALHALKNELNTAASFLPYLEAIKEVRDKQTRQKDSIR